MTTFRIGVIADTHVPEFLPALPKGIAQIFQNVNLILHAGDITGTEVLEQLQEIAPVVAVKGDHDKLDLDTKVVVELGGIRIGLLHGRRPRWQELPSLFYNTLAVKYYSWGGIHRYAAQNFERVNVIVFGHFHHPYIHRHRGVLIFNPGAIYQATPENVRKRLAITRAPWNRIYLRRSLLRPPLEPTVGILTIEDGVVQAEVISVPMDKAEVETFLEASSATTPEEE